MRKIALLALCLGLLCAYRIAYSQTYPFPRNVSYEYGFMSQYITDADVTAEYNTWVDKYYKECTDGSSRVDDGGITVSEGMGYGLVITAYMGDKERFDRLLKYYKARISGGVMNWQYNGCEAGPAGTGGATDAELDAAMGLIVACHQWPSGGYETDTDAILSNIKNAYFMDCGSLIVQKPGNAWGGCSCTNPSYYATGYYRAYAKYLENKGNINDANYWIKAASDAYTILFKNQHDKSGLVSAWCNQDGGSASGCNAAVSGGGDPDSFQYDAVRTPWRIATDYLWWGTDDAKQLLKPMVDFVNTTVGGIDNVKDGYNHDGTLLAGDRWHNAPFVGTFALASMSVNQDVANTFLEHYQTLAGDNYFNTCLSLMFKMLATGNFWNPYGSDVRCSKVNLGESASLCGAGSVTLNAGVDQQNDRVFTWSKDGTQQKSGAENTLSVTQEGTYTVRMDSANACFSEAEVFVNGSIPAVDLGDDDFLETELTLNAGVSGDALAFEWSKDGAVIPSAQEPTLTVTQAGTYKVVVSAQGCTSQEDEVVIDELPYISRTETAPSIDGVEDALYIGHRSLGNMLKGTPDEQDASASWSALWDNSNLYVFVTVTDNSLVNDSPEWYLDDGVEIYIDGDCNQGGSYDGTNDYQLGFTWNDTQVEEGGSNGSGQVSAIQYKIADVTGGYVLEAAIPWSFIGVQPSVGNAIGLDVELNDDDDSGPIENKLAWFASADNAWQNTRYFGKVILRDVQQVETPMQQVVLADGWNMVSLHVQPDDLSVTAVFPTAELVKSQDAAYISSRPAYLNSLKTIEPGKGYLVFSNGSYTAGIQGKEIVLPEPSLQSGWNLIGGGSQDASVETFFSTQPSVIKTFNGYWLQNGNKTFDTIKSGEAYFVKP